VDLAATSDRDLFETELESASDFDKFLSSEIRQLI